MYVIRPTGVPAGAVEVHVEARHDDTLRPREVEVDRAADAPLVVPRDVVVRQFGPRLASIVNVPWPAALLYPPTRMRYVAPIVG
jgi:hypothetical protein